jgi:Cu2+-exporting ATPase/Cu+-exporting ATPase
MAFGTPLALAFSLKSAAKKGFVLKTADVFSKVNDLKNVFLDKTGTLTHRKMKVQETVPTELNLELATIVLGLEMDSYHPVAEGLREFFAENLKLDGIDFKALSGVREIAGRGVQGFYSGKLYELRSSDSLTGKKSVGLFCEGNLVMQFIFEDPLMPGARELVGKFKAMGMNVFLLSGDSKNFVSKVGSELGILEANIFSEKKPTEKATIVAQSSGSLMIGDGVNDTSAFQKASLGVAVKGSVELALRSADVYFLSDNLEKLPEIINIAKRANSLIKRNLFISLAYNTLAGVSALMGFVNPLVAAVLMPISSGFILTHTWWSTRK